MDCEVDGVVAHSAVESPTTSVEDRHMAEDVRCKMPLTPKEPTIFFVYSIKKRTLLEERVLKVSAAKLSGIHWPI